MVTGEPYYGSTEPAAVPEYKGTYQGSNQGSNQEGTIGATSGSTTNQGAAQQAASNVANQVQQAASDVANKAENTAHVVLKGQRSNAAQNLNAVSSAVNQVSQQLSQNDQTAPFAGVMGAAADQIQNVAGYLEHHNVQQIVDEVRDFARREPALFLGGAFLAGLLAARFLKASPEQMQQQSAQQNRGMTQELRQGTTRQSNRAYGVYGYGRPYGGTYGIPPLGGRNAGIGRTYAPTANFRQGPAYGQPAWYGPNTTGTVYRGGNEVETGIDGPNTQG